MAICCYDNPKTMAREFWRDGRLIFSTPHRMCAEPTAVGWQSLIGSQLPADVHLGHWQAGQLAGDKSAIKPGWPGACRLTEGFGRPTVGAPAKGV